MSWTLFFEPLDVLVFKDHRPFLAGEHFFGRSSLPMPSALLGCVRTLLFERAFAQTTDAGFHIHDDYFGLKHATHQALLGGRNRPPGFSLLGPLLACLQHQNGARRVEPYFPVPRDLVPDLSSGVEVPQARCIQPRPVPGKGFHLTTDLASGQATFASEHVPCVPWREKGGKSDLSQTLLTAAGLRQWQQGTDTPLDPHRLVKEAELVQVEPRVGIARDPQTRCAAEHMLYGVETLRFGKQAGLTLQLEAQPEHEKTLRALLEPLMRMPPLVKPGGKSHLARLHVLEQSIQPELPEEGDGKRFKVVFLQPLPLDPQALTLEGYRLRSVITDRGEPLGGFDLAARAPKKLVSALGAGTVLFFEALDAAAALSAAAFRQRLEAGLKAEGLDQHPGHAGCVLGRYSL